MPFFKRGMLVKMNIYTSYMLNIDPDLGPFASILDHDFSLLRLCVSLQHKEDNHVGKILRLGWSCGENIGIYSH